MLCSQNASSAFAFNHSMNREPGAVNGIAYTRAFSIAVYTSDRSWWQRCQYLEKKKTVRSEKGRENYVFQMDKWSEFSNTYWGKQQSESEGAGYEKAGLMAETPEQKTWKNKPWCEPTSTHVAYSSRKCTSALFLSTFFLTLLSLIMVIMSLIVIITSLILFSFWDPLENSVFAP